MRVAGFVLVGGQSSRMRCDKARLLVGPRLLVEEVAANVELAAGNVALLGEAHRYRDLGFECLDDNRRCSGPLGGIETALLSSRGEFNLIVACDMPDLAVDSLRQLIEQAKRRESHCVICRDSTGRLQPLCAVWKQACLPQVRRALDEGRLKVLDLLQTLDVDYLQVDHPVRNVNTPEEWLAWRAEDLERSASLI